MMAPIMRRLSLLLLVTAFASASGSVHGQQAPAPKGAEWPTYGGDLASTRYSPLDQITKDNFTKLEVAWRFKTDALGPRPEFNFQATPLMVNGVVYSTAGTRRAVVALDAGTGEMLWMHSENEGKRGESAPRQLSGRGLAYWPGSGGERARIVYVTPGYQMVALDAKTGVPAAGFGKNGIVDLKAENDQPIDPITGEVGLHATPIIAKDVIVVGAAHLPGGAPKSRIHEKGFIRGYDARTGKRLWIFHTIPLAGEFGNDTWEKDSWSYTGNAGVWAQMTIDEENNLVFLPVELPTGDYYGGHHPGSNLFAESIVALDLKTGKRKWHYQMVHHGIWDMDVPCAPILMDLVVDGRPIKADRTADQAGMDLHVRSPHRETGLADRRAPGRKRHRARRVVFADAAVRHQAAAVRTSGRVARRSHRLHAGAQGGRPEARVALQAGADLHAAGREHLARAAGDVDAAQRHGRRQLAGRRVRSGNEDVLHLHEHVADAARIGEAGSDQVGLRLGTGHGAQS